MTVLAFERYPVDPSHQRAFEQAAADHLVAIRRAPGVLWADATRAFDDDPSYVVLSEWRTPGDADAFDRGAEAQGFAERIDPLLRGEVTRRRFSS